MSKEKAYEFNERFVSYRYGLVYARNAKEAREIVKAGGGETVEGVADARPTGGVQITRRPEEDR